MVSCRYLVIQTHSPGTVLDLDWKKRYILYIDSLMFNLDITHLSYSYRVFAGNLQKRKWKIDTSRGAIGGQNLFILTSN